MKTILTLSFCFVSFFNIGLTQEITPSTTHQLQVKKTTIDQSSDIQIQGNDLAIFQYFHQSRDEKTIQIRDKQCNEGIVNVNNQVLSIDLCEYHITVDAKYLNLEPIENNQFLSDENANYNVLFSSKKEYKIINSKSIIHRYFVDAGDLSIIPHKTFCGEIGGSVISVVYNQSKIEFTSLYDVTIVEMDSDNNGVKELFIIEDKGCADVLSIYQISKKQLM